jgi:hypothetical protein
VAWLNLPLAWLNRTLAWFNRTLAWLDRTLAWFDRTLVWFDRTFAWLNRTFPWFNRTLAWFDRTLAWFDLTLGWLDFAWLNNLSLSLGGCNFRLNFSGASSEVFSSGRSACLAADFDLDACGSSSGLTGSLSLTYYSFARSNATLCQLTHSRLAHFRIAETECSVQYAGLSLGASAQSEQIS